MRRSALFNLLDGRTGLLFIFAACLLYLSSCAAPDAESHLPATIPPPTNSLEVRVDGETRQLTTTASTVGEALEQAGIDLNPIDEIDPPLSSVLPSVNVDSPIGVTIVRVTETLEIIPESIPYGRRIVRSAEMSPTDAPRILQTGTPGLQEVSVRIVFRDGLEAERWPTSVQVIEPAVDEIVMIGVGQERDAMTITGELSYLSNGRAIFLDGSTDAPRQLEIAGTIDGRVFELSPDGRYLLYTLDSEDTNEETFGNELWVIATQPGAVGRALQIENVLWAGWDPSAGEPPRIAYTTARSVSLPPGWEALNDLWLLPLPTEGEQAAPIRIVESAPATFGWWGGNYAWAPGGDRIAYAFADEIGTLAIPPVDSASEGASLPPTTPIRSVLHDFTAYETGADWAWLPNLAWSADGRYLSYTAYSIENERFDLWLVDTTTTNAVQLAENVGMWAAADWSPTAALPQLSVAYLQVVDPAAGEESSYALWLAESDGSNKSRVFPPEGETGFFDRTRHSLTWGPNPDLIAFILDEKLHILDLVSNDLFRTGTDDTVNSHPTWAPYGPATQP